MQVFEAQVKIPMESQLGEGALWDVRDRALYWVDILGSEVYRLDPEAGGPSSWQVGQHVTTVVVAEDGRLVLGLRHGFAWLDLSSGRVTSIVDPEPDNPDTRMNDGKCDPQGRFWAGTMVERGERGRGGLYCLGADLSLTRKLSGVSCSNGLVWTRDQRTFYYIDTPTHRIDAFDYEPTSGQIAARRTVAEIPRELGAPDGMAIDAEDRLWVALFGGSAVVCVDPRDGAVKARIEVGAQNVTSCAFGGPELRDLYITTARVGMSAQQLAELPQSGSLFCVTLPVAGVPSPRFAGRG